MTQNATAQDRAKEARPAHEQERERGVCERRQHHSMASSVRSTGVTMEVSPVSLSVMRKGLRV